MPPPHWNDLENLILVAGHAVYIANNFDTPTDDRNWYLQEFQKGEPPFYIEHIYRGVELTTADVKSLLVFSGGQTRLEAGPKSEAQSYWMIADHFCWWWRTNVKIRATTEEFAQDSFQNLLFGICRFYECTGRYPEVVTVISWAFKKQRFELHRDAIRFPTESFHFMGANNPVDLAGAMKGEGKAIDSFAADPYGAGKDLGSKRTERNPFDRTPPYSVSCPDLGSFLRHRGPERFTGPLPWD
jgi:hypothetical protein